MRELAIECSSDGSAQSGLRRFSLTTAYGLAVADTAPAHVRSPIAHRTGAQKTSLPHEADDDFNVVLSTARSLNPASSRSYRPPGGGAFTYIFAMPVDSLEIKSVFTSTLNPRRSFP